MNLAQISRGKEEEEIKSSPAHNNFDKRSQWIKTVKFRGFWVPTSI